MQLRLIADAGGLTAVDGEIARTTPIRLSRSTQPFSNIVREEQSESVDLRVESANGRPILAVRATLYGPKDRSFPAHSLRGPDPCPCRYASTRALSGSRCMGCDRVAAGAEYRCSGLAQGCCRRPEERRRAWRLDLLASFRAAGREPAPDRLRRLLQRIAIPDWLILSNPTRVCWAPWSWATALILNHQARVGFERTCSFHLLVVSGMHLAIFAACIFGLAALLRLPRVWSTVVTIACSFAYALLAGFGEPVQRSFWMVTLYLLARLLFRELIVSTPSASPLFACSASIRARSGRQSPDDAALGADRRGVAVPGLKIYLSALFASRSEPRLGRDRPWPPSAASPVSCHSEADCGHLQPFRGERFARILVPALPARCWAFAPPRSQGW